MRADMGAQAAMLARACDYRSAGQSVKQDASNHMEDKKENRAYGRKEKDN